ncbi:MAG: L,D-transpeptidase family protein [Thermomicrobiales bacterium]
MPTDSDSASNNRGRLTRRALVAGLAGVAAGSIVRRESAFASSLISEAALRSSLTSLDMVQWPPDVGQTPLQVYFKDSGHTLRGTMLDYWRANGGAVGFGLPISEPFALNGYYSQAFQKVVLQYIPEYQWVDAPVMRAAPIGSVIATATGDLTTDVGVRAFGGGDRRSSVWTPLDPNGDSANNAVARGGVFFQESGHTLTDDFLTWYQANDGVYYLGQPISQQFTKAGARWQYFEGGALRKLDKGVDSLRLVNLALSRLGVDMTEVEQGDLSEYDESLFKTTNNPYPQGSENAPGRKWVEVSLNDQQLWAYQGSTLVLTTLVSTGLSPNNTSAGTFYTRLKYPKQDMKGFTDETGEVTITGEDNGGDDSLSSYDVTDVPDVVYFSTSAEALHGTYWHNNFGNPMSHGCINLPLDVAHWFYGWAPLGVMVWVHE